MKTRSDLLVLLLSSSMKPEPGIKAGFGYGFQHRNAFGDKFDGRSIRRREERAARRNANMLGGKKK